MKGYADLSLNYRGQFVNKLQTTSEIPANRQWAGFQQTSNELFSVRELSAAGANISGLGGTYEFSTVDPTNVVNNATAITGSWFSEDLATTGLRFGTLTGTVSVAIAADNPINENLLTAPLAFNWTYTQAVTTQLDRNGLVAPRVTVSDGIDMSGSRISNLDAGVAATDAVNVAQMNAAVGSEAAARTSADFALSQRIDAREAVDNTLAANLATETASRLAADSALSTRLDAFGGRLDQIDLRLDRLEARVASSTAVAVAMSGNAFLPGTRFNLTANVATYGGAQAGSIQLGAMVGPNVAVNAAVASGFNRGGKTAARAGFTIGW